VRYDPARVSDLAAVTSPPYDVIDADSAAHLEQLDPHNVVRLILPRSLADDRQGAYDDAAARLAAWLADGTLQRDAEPAIYVYEQLVDGRLQRGIFAAVELRDPAERVVLPHEDVMPGPVADRLDLMRATRANLEPILLVYEGRFRPPEHHVKKWTDYQADKIMRGLTALEADPPSLDTIPNVGQIALACFLGHRDLRFAGDWRAAHPRLVVWLDRFAAKVPAFAETKVAA